MKTKYACAIAALCLFITAAAVCANIYYTERTAELIENGIDRAAGDADELRLLQKLWDDRRQVLELSHSEPELDAISLLFEEAIIWAENHDTAEYEKTAARLRRAAENLKKLEVFSLSNIF